MDMIGLRLGLVWFLCPKNGLSRFHAGVIRTARGCQAAMLAASRPGPGAGGRFRAASGRDADGAAAEGPRRGRHRGGPTRAGEEGQETTRPEPVAALN